MRTKKYKKGGVLGDPVNPKKPNTAPQENFVFDNLLNNSFPSASISRKNNKDNNKSSVNTIVRSGKAPSAYPDPYGRRSFQEPVVPQVGTRHSLIKDVPMGWTQIENAHEAWRQKRRPILEKQEADRQARVARLREQQDIRSNKLDRETAAAMAKRADQREKTAASMRNRIDTNRAIAAQRQKDRDLTLAKRRQIMDTPYSIAELLPTMTPGVVKSIGPVRPPVIPEMVTEMLGVRSPEKPKDPPTLPPRPKPIRKKRNAEITKTPEDLLRGLKPKVQNNQFEVNPNLFERSFKETPVPTDDFFVRPADRKFKAGGYLQDPTDPEEKKKKKKESIIGGEPLPTFDKNPTEVGLFSGLRNFINKRKQKADQKRKEYLQEQEGKLGKAKVQREAEEKERIRKNAEAVEKYKREKGLQDNRQVVPKPVILPSPGKAPFPDILGRRSFQEPVRPSNGDSMKKGPGPWNPNAAPGRELPEIEVVAKAPPKQTKSLGKVSSQNSPKSKVSPVTQSPLGRFKPKISDPEMPSFEKTPETALGPDNSFAVDRVDNKEYKVKPDSINTRDRQEASAGDGKQGFTTGDALQFGTVMGKALMAFRPAQKERRRAVDTPITKQVFDPSVPLAANNRAMSAAARGLGGSASVRRAATAALNANKIAADNNVLQQYDNMNKQANTQYEQRLDQRKRTNIDIDMRIDDLDARNAGARFGLMDNALNSMSNFGIALNDKKAVYKYLETLKVQYPEVYDDIMSDIMDETGLFPKRKKKKTEDK
jgi:hypothetical protein